MFKMFATMEYWTEENDEILEEHYDSFTIEATCHGSILRTMQEMVDELDELGWEVVGTCTESLWEDDGYFPEYEITPRYHERMGKQKVAFF